MIYIRSLRVSNTFYNLSRRACFTHVSIMRRIGSIQVRKVITVELCVIIRLINVGSYWKPIRFAVCIVVQSRRSLANEKHILRSSNIVKVTVLGL